MALSRTAPAAAGLGLLGLAVLAVLSPAIAAILPVGAVVEVLGNDYLLTAAVAVLALAALLAVLATRATTGVTEATPPPVEGTAAGAPGRDLDATLDSLSPFRVTERHRRVHARLRTAAVETVAEADRCSRPAASDRVDSGEWTDDAAAAAFVADETLDPPGLVARVTAVLRREHWFRRRVDATVTAMETVGGEST